MHRYVVAGTIQSAFKFNPRWLAVLIAIAVALFASWYMKDALAEYLFGILNACLIYLTGWEYPRSGDDQPPVRQGAEPLRGRLRLAAPSPISERSQ